MLQWITENAPTLVVGAVVLAIVAAIAVKLIKDAKNHNSSCGCGCKGCPNSGMCHGGK